jgi:hypothetical protein
MAERTDIDIKRLWESAQQGLSAQELMEKMNIKDMATLKQALGEAMREKGESVAVPGLIDDAALRMTYSQEGIRIPPAMLEGTGFKEGDIFNIKVEGDRITLQKTKPDPTIPK